MKTLLSTAIAIILLISASSYAITVKIDPGLIDPDQTTSFDVIIENASDLGAFQFDLTYDPAVVSFAGVVLGDFLGSTGRKVWELPADINNSGGKLTFGAFTSAPDGDPNKSGPSGDGTLATLTFSLKTQDDGVLTFDPNRSWLTNTKTGTALPAQWVGGEITPTCTITATPGDHGSITPSGIVIVKKGTDQTFAITPQAPCYDIADVAADGTSVGPVTTYTFPSVTEDHTLTASFAFKPPYTIEASAGTGGTISPSGSISVNCGGSQTFTVTPDTAAPDCYHITDLKVNNVSVGAQTAYTFSNVTGNYSIAAIFAPNDYKITATAGLGGTISPSGEVSLSCGTQNFTITPDTSNNYEIGDVLIDGVSVGAMNAFTLYADKMTGTSHTIEARFVADSHPITVGIVGNGTVSPSTVNVAHGANQTFTITPGDCYQIEDVVIDGVSAGPVTSYEFKNVAQAHTLAVLFTVKTHIITLSSGEGEAVNPAGEVTVTCGSSREFTIARPDECTYIKDIQVDNVSVMDTVQTDEDGTAYYIFTGVKEDHRFHAVFEKFAYTITASAGKNGTIEPSGEVVVKCGENQLFQITPKDEAHPILEVRVNGVDVGKQTEYLFENVTEDNHRIHAIFEGDDIYIITASVAGQGDDRIEPSGEVVVIEGDSQTFAIVSDETYPLLDLWIDGESAGPMTEYTFSGVREDHTILAIFERHDIEVIAGENGEISPSANISVPHEQSQEITFAPDTCYQIADVLADDVSVMDKVTIDEAGAGAYTFDNVTEAHRIEVKFERSERVGDVDGNEKIEIRDAVLSLKLSCGKEIEPETEIHPVCADKDGDKKTGIAEASFILRHISK